MGSHFYDVKYIKIIVARSEYDCAAQETCDQERVWIAAEITVHSLYMATLDVPDMNIDTHSQPQHTSYTFQIPLLTAPLFRRLL